MITMSTPFDEESVDFCEDADVDIIKIASFDLNDWPLVYKVLEKKRPTIVSIGGTGVQDIDHIVNLFNDAKVPLAINQCVSIYPSEPFDYYFVDEKLAAGYNAEMRMGRIFGYFSFIGILIACLGLFGLMAFTIEQKFKEIGVHKILGASVPNIIYLISKDYLRWIVISNLAAWPVAWFAMNKWLQNFAYRIEISWWIFVLSGGIALVIALATVSFQAIKAAVANPIESLRYE